jgi:hypothetical protein
LVEVDAESYRAVDHGYATTIHKSQGATVDRAFVLASESMDRHLAYVGITRHRAAVTLYAARDEFRDLTALSNRLGRSNAKETTLDYERAGYAERRGLHGLVPESEIVVRDVARASPTAAGREQEGPAQARREEARPAEAQMGQARPTEARPSGPTRKPGAERQPEDSLREKVRAARERMQAGNEPVPGHETPQDKLRRELRGLDSLSLGWAVEAASVRDRDAHYPRPMTVADAARRVSPAYATAADRLEEIRKDIAYSERAIETYSGQRDYAIDQGDERWRKMGTLAQYGHRIGVRPDYAMSTHERDEKVPRPRRSWRSSRSALLWRTRCSRRRCRSRESVIKRGCAIAAETGAMKALSGREGASAR